MLVASRRLFRTGVAEGLRFMSVGMVGAGAGCRPVQAFHVVDIFHIGGDELAPRFDVALGALFLFVSLGEAFADASSNASGRGCGGLKASGAVF